MSNFNGKRVSASHLELLREAERRGILTSINQGRRTLAEQAVFYAAYLRFLAGGPKAPLAAKPSPTAPHIKTGHEHHALDINDGVVDRVAEMYRELGVRVAFNVANEPWHMDTVDEASLIRAAASLRAARGILATLRPGVRHADVHYAQQLLREAGYWPRGRKLGKSYGPAMRKVVTDFQRGHFLKPDGVIGKGTWAALKESSRLRAIARRDPRTVSTRGLRLLQKREGTRLEPYNDSAGHATIGTGHLIHRGPVTQADRVKYATFTSVDADRLLRQDLAKVEAAITRSVLVPLDEHEHAALCSLGFNIGVAGLESSTVVRRLNAGNRHGAADAFLMWDKPKDVLSRRRAERLQFLGDKMVART